jgi:hypothetical protein
MIIFLRERREDKVFRELLKMGLGLRERLLEAPSADEVELVADLVRGALNFRPWSSPHCAICRFRREPMPLELTTPRD